MGQTPQDYGSFLVAPDRFYTWGTNNAAKFLRAPAGTRMARDLHRGGRGIFRR
jgi:hypothetical protein